MIRSLTTKSNLVLIVLFLLLLQTSHVFSRSECGFIQAAWHPTDDLFAISCNNVVSIYTTEFQLVKTLTSPPEPDLTAPEVTALAWSPNGLYLAAAITRADAPGGDGSASRLVVWEVSSGNLLLNIPRFEYPIAWSPDSRLIATNSLTRDGLYFYDIGTGSEVSRCLECPGEAMAWNPTDIHQFIVSQGQRILFLDPLASSNPSPEIVKGIAMLFRNGGYSPDGTRIVVYETQVSQLKIIDSYTKHTIATLPYRITGTVKDYQWLQDGIYISKADGGVLRWNGTSEPEVLLATVDTSAYWKPDGTKYLVSNRDGSFVRDTATGAIISQRLIEDLP